MPCGALATRRVRGEPARRCARSPAATRAERLSCITKTGTLSPGTWKRGWTQPWPMPKPTPGWERWLLRLGPIADIQARLHASQTAELVLQTTKEDPHDPSIAAMTHFVRGRLAAEAGDSARAAAEMEAFGTAYADPRRYQREIRATAAGSRRPSKQRDILTRPMRCVEDRRHLCGLLPIPRRPS